MVRGIVVSLLCLLAMPSAAQYNIKKMMEEGRRTLDRGYYVASMKNIMTVLSSLIPMPWKSVPITVMTGSTVLTACTRRVTDRLLSASWIIFSAAGRILKRLPGCTMTSLPGADLSRSPYVRPAGRSSRCRVWPMVETLQY